MMRQTAFFLSCLACACDGKRLLPVSNVASAFQATGAVGAPSRSTAAKMYETQEDLKVLAKKLNPFVDYWDPLNLAGADWWDQSNEATIGFLRHAEIKHGRVAMAAFVGYCLQSNGIIWPWKLTGEISHADIAAAGGPADQWDALPTAAKLQIILFVGILEWWGENSYILEKDGQKHYMRGGVPGKFPSFAELPHPVPFNLYDPFKLNAKRSREDLDRSLLAEINNGRLAQIGIFGLISASKGLIVPGLDGLGIKPYAGEVMAPLNANDVALPYVSEMLKLNPLEGVKL